MGHGRKSGANDPLFWFSSRELRQKIRKIMPPQYFKRFPLYFEQYGCIHCKSRRVPHQANGLCSACSALIRLRFDRIEQSLNQERQSSKPERAVLYMQKVSSARQLVADIRDDPANRKFLSRKSPSLPAYYLGTGRKRGVHKGDFDTGKLSWKRVS